MSLIAQTIKELKLPLSRKQKMELAEALKASMAELIDRSITHGFYAGSGKSEKKKFELIRRTFNTNI